METLLATPCSADTRAVSIITGLSALIRYVQPDKLQTSVVSYFRMNSCISSNFSERILNQSRGHEHIKSLLCLFIYLLFWGSFWTRPSAPCQLIQGSAKLQREGGLEMSQSRSERESKAIFSAQQHSCKFMEKVIVSICQSLTNRLFLIIYFFYLFFFN